MTAAATTAAGEQTSATSKADDAAQDVEDTAAADQGDEAADDTDSGDTEEDWKAKYEAQQRINRNLERRTRRDKTRIEELEGKKPAPAKDAKGADSKADTEVDVEKIRADALEQAKKEAAQEALQERVHDKIELKAAKQFADPEDAVAMLLRTNKIEDFIDGGKVDVDAIQDALTELLEKKPYLAAAAQGGKQRFQGSAEGGAKSSKPARPKSLHEAVSRRYNASP